LYFVLDFVAISYQEGEDVAKNLNGCPVAHFVHAHFRPTAQGFYVLSVQHNFVDSQMRLNC